MPALVTAAEHGCQSGHGSADRAGIQCRSRRLESQAEKCVRSASGQESARRREGEDGGPVGYGGGKRFFAIGVLAGAEDRPVHFRMRGGDCEIDDEVDIRGMQKLRNLQGPNAVFPCL